MTAPMTNPAHTALVEKVARAMCARDGANWDAPDCNHTANGEEPEEQREYWIDKATAAIAAVLEALQEPSHAMFDAVGKAGWSDVCGNSVWQAMLSASPLKEGE